MKKSGYLLKIGAFPKKEQTRDFADTIFRIIGFGLYTLYKYCDSSLQGSTISKDLREILVKMIVNDTLRMYKNDDIRMYNFDCITDTIVEVITTCNTYTLLTVHLL